MFGSGERVRKVARPRRAPWFKHPTALVEAKTVGPGTRIWAYAHVMHGAVIGSACNVGDHCYIESGVTIGDRVTIKNGVALWDGVTVESDVFLGPSVTLTNDLYPRSLATDWERRCTRIRAGATIGANATVLCGITIGSYAMIGAGSVVTKDVAPYTIVAGNPARPMGYACRCGTRLRVAGTRASCPRCRRRFLKHGGTLRAARASATAKRANGSSR